MKSRLLLLIGIISTIFLTGCQSSDLAAENEALKQQITELEQQITELEQSNNANASNENESAAETSSSNHGDTQNTNSSQTNGNAQNTGNNNSATATTTYTMEELAAMVDEFVASVGSVTPDVNNSGNLDQFFSLKREADQIEHALENHENSLENQYRAGNLTREEYRKLDKEIELLEDTLDSAKDRLEITFGIDD